MNEEYKKALIGEEKYTIIATEFHYGQIIQNVNKEDVRINCEKLKKLFNLAKENAYCRIEVINNQTGEMREYWNNHENKINF